MIPPIISARNPSKYNPVTMQAVIKNGYPTLRKSKLINWCP